MVIYLEGEIWLRITSKISWFALYISSLWYFVSCSITPPFKENVHLVPYKSDGGVSGVQSSA